MFRSTVVVDGKEYTSLGTFSTKKAAQQDVAKLALESLSETVSNKTADEAFPRIDEDRTFSKSILYEFAAKEKLAMPTYETVRLESTVRRFVSSLVFDGVKYIGQPGLNKKEAEQFAARAVILSLLANTGAETPLSAIVKSKSNYISAVHEHVKVNTSVVYLPNSGSDVGTYALKEIVSDNGKQNADMTVNVTSEPQSASKSSRLLDSTTKFRQPNLETVSEPNFLPYQTIPQPSLLPSSQTFLNPALMSNAQAPPQPSRPKYESASSWRGKKKKFNKKAKDGRQDNQVGPSMNQLLVGEGRRSLTKKRRMGGRIFSKYFRFGSILEKMRFESSHMNFLRR